MNLLKQQEARQTGTDYGTPEGGDSLTAQAARRMADFHLIRKRLEENTPANEPAGGAT